MEDMPGSSPSCENATWTDANAYYTCQVGTYKAWVWGLFGFFVGSITLGLAARWFNTRNQWMIREGPRKNRGQHYVKRWFGWQKLGLYNQERERRRELTTIIRQAFQWKTTTKDYCSSLIWDPGCMLWKEQQKKRNQTWIGRLPKWIRSYEPQSTQKHLREGSERHVSGRKERSTSDALSSAEQGFHTRCFRSSSSQENQRTKTIASGGHSSDFIVRHYLENSTSRHSAILEKAVSDSDRTTNLCLPKEQLAKPLLTNLQDEKTHIEFDQYLATSLSIPFKKLDVDGSTSTIRRHKNRSNTAQSWNAESGETTRALRYQLLVDRPTAADSPQEYNEAQRLDLSASSLVSYGWSSFHCTKAASSVEVSHANDGFGIKEDSIIVIKSRDKIREQFGRSQQLLGRNSDLLDGTSNTSGVSQVLYHEWPLRSIKSHATLGDVDEESIIDEVDGYKTVDSVMPAFASGSYVDISKYEAEDQFDHYSNSSSHGTHSSSDGHMSHGEDTAPNSQSYKPWHGHSTIMEEWRERRKRHPLQSVSASHLQQAIQMSPSTLTQQMLNATWNGSFKDEKLEITVGEKYGESLSRSCLSTTADTINRVDHNSQAQNLDETEKPVKVQGLKRLANSLTSSKSVSDWRTAISRRNQSSQSIHPKEEDSTKGHNLQTGNRRTFAGQISPRFTQGRTALHGSDESPLISKKNPVMEPPGKFEVYDEKLLTWAPKKRPSRSLSLYRTLVTWNARRRKSRNQREFPTTQRNAS